MPTFRARIKTLDGLREVDVEAEHLRVGEHSYELRDGNQEAVAVFPERKTVSVVRNDALESEEFVSLQDR